MATANAATTTSSLPQQSPPTVKDITDELKEKIDQIEKDLKDQGKMRKRSIYREYADLIANFIPAEMVCDEICKYFPKDERIIRHALDNKSLSQNYPPVYSYAA
jgi:hypothetical protein